MKYEIVKNNIDDYSIKYKDKEIRFHSDVEIATEMQKVNKNAIMKAAFDLSALGKTLNDLVVVVKKNEKTYYDNSNKDALIKAYQEDEMGIIFQNSVKKMLGIEFSELVKEIGIETEEESQELSIRLGEILTGRF